MSPNQFSALETLIQVLPTLWIAYALIVAKRRIALIDWLSWVLLVIDVLAITGGWAVEFVMLATLVDAQPAVGAPPDPRTTRLLMAAVTITSLTAASLVSHALVAVARSIASALWGQPKAAIEAPASVSPASELPPPAAPEE